MASAATCLATILCCGPSSMLQQKGTQYMQYEISLMNHHKKDSGIPTIYLNISSIHASFIMLRKSSLEDMEGYIKSIAIVMEIH